MVLLSYGRISIKWRSFADDGRSRSDECSDFSELRFDPGLGVGSDTRTGRFDRSSLLRLASQYYRTLALGTRKTKRKSGSRGLDQRLKSRLRDGHIHVLVLYRHYDIAVLVIAEDFGSEFFQAAQGFRCWMTVRVVRSGLDHGNLGPKIIQEQ